MYQNQMIARAIVALRRANEARDARSTDPTEEQSTSAIPAARVDRAVVLHRFQVALGGLPLK